MGVVENVISNKWIKIAVGVVVLLIALWLCDIIIRAIGGYFNFDLGVGSSGMHYHIGTVRTA